MNNKQILVAGSAVSFLIGAGLVKVFELIRRKNEKENNREKAEAARMLIEAAARHNVKEIEIEWVQEAEVPIKATFEGIKLEVKGNLANGMKVKVRFRKQWWFWGKIDTIEVKPVSSVELPKAA